MPLEPTANGLLARAGEYEPLRAFSQGGRYWDRVPQQLIREGALAEFLPPVEVEEDERGHYGRFHWEQGRRESLSRSRPVGQRGIPAEQARRLLGALEEFRQAAHIQSAQPQNRELIERFRLPDVAHDPELYRLAGPWWNRRLQILWGCERTRDSSLPAAVAAGKLRQDTSYNLRRALTALLLLLLLLLLAWWLYSHWPWLSPPAHSSPAAQAEAQRQAKQAADAAVKAARADAEAKRTQAVADKAKAEAVAAKKAADQAKAAPPEAQRNPPSPNPGTTPTNGTQRAPLEAKTRCQIVLCEQGQPAADGTMEVTLEVRTATKPPRVVPVEAWQFEGQTVTSADRLQTRMKGGQHPVKAVVQDAAGKRLEVSAVVTVEPGKVITTPGKVSVRAR